jgi:hypothetical protein
MGRPSALAGGYFQFLHRDPTGPAGNRVARSDGLAVTLEP